MDYRKEFFRYATKHHGVSTAALQAHADTFRGMTRSVIEERPQPFREIDVFSRLIMEHIIFLGSEINDHVANIIVAQLLFLESVDDKKDVTLYINSPGGSVYAGLAIYDTMQYVGCPISTVCVGLAASMGAILLAGGAKGKRAALPHARIMIHQPLGETKGRVIDMEIAVKQGIELGQDLYGILATHTGKSREEVQRDADRDNWMRATAAMEYGIIDGVLTKA